MNCVKNRITYLFLSIFIVYMWRIVWMSLVVSPMIHRVKLCRRIRITLTPILLAQPPQLRWLTPGLSQGYRQIRGFLFFFLNTWRFLMSWMPFPQCTLNDVGPDETPLWHLKECLPVILRPLMHNSIPSCRRVIFSVRVKENYSLAVT